MSEQTQEVKLTGDAAQIRKEKTWNLVFLASTAIAIIFLITLIISIVNGVFGYVIVKNEVNPTELARNGIALEDLPAPELINIMNERMREGLVRRYDFEKPLAERSREELLAIIVERVVNPSIERAWNLIPSLLNRREIYDYAALHPEGWLQFRTWVNPDFVRKPQSSVPAQAGIRTAILGSLWTILITIFLAFPIGVGAAIYLEEYAPVNRLTHFIQVNIYNLSGVPSIIYGILGLAVFVRMLEPFTSGSMFGAVADPTTANGRTVLSAGMTLALLILPVIIINAQEAIKAVPGSLRDSSYGVGATKWQTVWSHVLPNSFDRILTGTILAMSRAIGETAPLVVVGASTFVAIDPAGLFSKFTTLPIQIYQWTARPQHEFRNIAAAAIVVLLVLLLSMNTFAILMRNKISKDRRLL